MLGARRGVTHGRHRVWPDFFGFSTVLTWRVPANKLARRSKSLPGTLFMNRRELLIGATGCVAGACAGWVGSRARSIAPPAVIATSVSSRDGHEPGIAPAEALARLLAGNRRFAAGQSIRPHDSANRREALSHDQRPFAVVLGCSDSRVPPEIVFDAGLGDLFIVRQAGHVADDDTLGSLEYAVGHLGVRLIAVVGHERCGAVTAAVGTVLRDESVPGHVLRLVDDIAPAVFEVQHQGGDLIDNAVRANIQLVVRLLEQSAAVLRPLVRRGDIRLVGMYYPLASGLVELLE
jgi:carbonic anhydrase